TSGTVLPIDKHFQPLHNALMYSDNRSTEQGKRCSQLASTYNKDGYAGFNSSSGLSKMVWFVEAFPSKVKNIHKWIHAADYIIGMLSGCWGITDYTNVLKSGYDLKNLKWPDYLFKHLPLQKEWMPEVVSSGRVITTLHPSVAKATGLPTGIKVVTGMTDGCASQIASGAVRLGDWNTTIGTTLVIKGITKEEINDPEDRLYNHRHPEGFWMPGGASNIGADWVAKKFQSDLEWLNREASGILPTGIMSYPLQRQGERFPFIAPEARGFEPNDLTKLESYASCMEGVAYIERYAYEMIEKLSGEKVKVVYTAGGGSNSESWLTIRANVLNLPICKMKNVTGAAGAAILAASKTYFSTIMDAATSVTQIDKKINPQPSLAAKYDVYYHQFINLLQEKGFIRKEAYA
ncbi:MAG: FGGY-family carbohydrate kinase, partial [Chitinophagaceae bacterium]